MPACSERHRDAVLPRHLCVASMTSDPLLHAKREELKHQLKALLPGELSLRSALIILPGSGLLLVACLVYAVQFGDYLRSCL
jgi:hypothetical protein